MAKHREDTRGELDAETKQKFFRKPDRGSIPKPANEAIPGDGARETMETEPKSEPLAARTNGRQPKPLGRGYGTTKCESRVPSPYRNFNKGRMGKTNEPGGHVVDIRNPEQTTKGNTERNEAAKEDSRGERKCKDEVLKKYCQLNVRGLITSIQPQEKVELLRDIMHEERPLFLALTETWLHDHSEAEVHIDEYTVYRKDRPLRRSIDSRGRHVGGVALYIKSAWLPDSKEILGYSNSVVDVLVIHSKRENMIIAVLYRQPENKACSEEEYRSTHKDFVEPLGKLEEVITKYRNLETEIQILGDFNMPSADWEMGKYKEDALADQRMLVTNTQELCEKLLLQQIITIPTHQKGNTLDLVFTNKPEQTHSQWSRNTALSDHYLITFNSNRTEEFEYSNENTNKNKSEYGFHMLDLQSKEINWKSLGKSYRTDWRKLIIGKTKEEAITSFQDHCVKKTYEYVPKKVGKPSGKKRRIPRDRRILMRRRAKVDKQIWKHPLREKLKEERAEIERKILASHKNERKRKEDKAIEACKNNPKYFFSYAKRLRKVKQNVGPIIDRKGEVISDNGDMAEIIHDQYETTWSEPIEPLEEADKMFPDEEETEETTDQTIRDIDFNINDIKKAMGELEETSASGPDQFPSIILKKCREYLAEPIYLIWRISLDSSEIPDIYKTANVAPIHKGGSKGEAKNYRPVALTSHIIKIFEKILRKKIIEFLQKTGKLSDSQHGFRSGRSTLSQLLSHFDKVLTGLERGEDVHVVYLDFAKAFDKVDFGVVLKKLKSLGIRGKLGRWIHCFLTGRTQRVVVGGASSSVKEVISGVPQGSVLGPLLFLIMIGDIDKSVLTAFLSSFADDTRVGHGIKTMEDLEKFQKDLDNIYEWASKNNMKFNSSKFECIRYGEEKFPTVKQLNDQGEMIEAREHVKDLGIHMSQDCTFGFHIRNVAVATKGLCNWVLRVFQTRDEMSMKKLFTYLIRSKLEYGCQIWNPTKKQEIVELEMVQRQFIKRIEDIEHLTYPEQLKKLKFYSLERRRERYLIIYLWKMMENLVPKCIDLKRRNGGRNGRSFRLPLLCRTASTRLKTIRDESFFVQSVKLFNSLPRNIRDLKGCSVEAFKKELDKFLQKLPDAPLIPGYTASSLVGSNSVVDWCSWQKCVSKYER